HYENQKVVGAGYGIGYVSALPVKKGEVYYLMVNYAENSYKSGSNVGSGFTIYFYNYWPKKPPFLKSKDPSKVYLVLDNILFETNKTSLSNANKKALDNLGKQLIENKTTYISIEGFTDNVGADSLNQKLSEERATAVKSYLIAKGVESSRIRTKGLGSKNAVASNKNEKGRIKNRRVELRVLNYP
ncbi:MAG: OmpA family protein, partial [Bacteroidia bacterium]|nr:OmpA family protein [Bacteroidia bacterium]